MSLSFYSAPSLPADEQDRQQAVVASGALAVPPPADLRHILSEACRIFRTSSALITIVFQDHTHVIASSDFATGLYRRSTSLCAHAVLDPSGLFVIPDALQDERFAANPFVEGPGGIRFYAAAALHSGGQPIGTVCVIDTSPRDGITAEQAEALRSLSTAAMELLERPVHLFVPTAMPAP